jgi:serine/threonine protein kinase
MLQGVAIDQRADIFSWGVITWELLTGHRLFQADTPEETLALLGEAPVLSPTDFQPDLPPSFEQIVMTALKRERSQRMSNVQALCTQLEAVPFSPASMPYRVVLLKQMNPSWHNTNATGSRD